MIVLRCMLRYIKMKIKHFIFFSWEQFPDPDKHIGALKLRHSLRLLGFNFTMLDMDVVARQVRQLEPCGKGKDIGEGRERRDFVQHTKIL